MAILVGQQLGVEAVQRRSVLGLHDRLDVGGRSWMTWAVMRVLVSSTGAVASSSQPIQSPRPSATISIPVTVRSTSKAPRLARSQAHFGVGVR
jgi:hypothetical protein